MVFLIMEYCDGLRGRGTSPIVEGYLVLLGRNSPTQNRTHIAHMEAGV